ncbi:MAG: excinuclease ABC subunit UvrC [Candidatus Melainabacteria bacterium]|nr:excinuclease ABC subunit UvrC [Candidatus Melainabacteria bacterium]
MKARQLSQALEYDLASLPDQPGVYFFKNEHNQTIYIGKAVNLRARVKSYWSTTSWGQRPKLAVMVPRIFKVEAILTNSEKEALILEATLVRKYMPQYNVALKDDKRYPWLAITYDEPFPRLIMVRDAQQFRKQNPKARVFGPFVEAGAMWETVRALRKVFPMRQRKKPLFKDRPCMNYYIGLCLGPCQNLVGEDLYNHMAKQVEMFLAGRQTEVVLQLRQEMEASSQRLEFEQAARIRDRLHLLETVVEKQQVFFDSHSVSQDILAEAHNQSVMCVCLLRVREGKLVSSEAVSVPLIEKTTSDEAFQSFVDQYYTACEDITLPKEAILQHSLEDMQALAQVLSTKAHKQVKVMVPRGGKKLDLIKMAEKNARMALEKELQDKSVESPELVSTLAKLRDELVLTKLPYRIECFDISNTQGTDNVASMIVFENGKPKKSEYRHFKIRTVEGEPNDFASMKEAVFRRYQQVPGKMKLLPDLIVIDGGKGQLGAALTALEELKMGTVDIIGLAKRQEEVYLPGRSQAVILPRRSAALHMLQRARDEAHRFAVNFHRKLRAKRVLSSNFEMLPGVGKARRKALVSYFGTFEKLKVAAPEEIEQVPGLPKAIAQNIYAALHSSAKVQ